VYVVGGAAIDHDFSLVRVAVTLMDLADRL
jgi:hypothetical protein